MKKITGIQSLTTSQRTANISNMSKTISKKMQENVIISSQSNSLLLLNNLKEIEKLTNDMLNLNIVTKYLLIKFLQLIGINSCCYEKLNCKQLKIAIKELERQIGIIKMQRKTDAINRELQDTKLLLKNLKIKFKNKCNF